MILFAQKMYALTKLRADHDENGQIFSKQQRKLLYATTKYVTLLLFAMISSWITILMGAIENTLTGDITNLAAPLSNVDCVVNIICLYLQFPFAKEYYDKYCVCFANCCTHLFMNCAKKRIQRSKENNIEIGDNSSAKFNLGDDKLQDAESKVNRDDVFCCRNWKTWSF